MIAKVNLDSITFQNNPQPYTQPIHLNVKFSVVQPLTSSLDWKIIYVGSAYSEDYDQLLEVFTIEPSLTPTEVQFSVEC